MECLPLKTVADIYGAFATAKVAKRERMSSQSQIMQYECGALRRTFVFDGEYNELSIPWDVQHPLTGQIYHAGEVEAGAAMITWI
jgi:hypothetical protein